MVRHVLLQQQNPPNILCTKSLDRCPHQLCLTRMHRSLLYRQLSTRQGCTSCTRFVRRNPRLGSPARTSECTCWCLYTVSMGRGRHHTGHWHCTAYTQQIQVLRMSVLGRPSMVSCCRCLRPPHPQHTQRTVVCRISDQLAATRYRQGMEYTGCSHCCRDRSGLERIRHMPCPPHLHMFLRHTPHILLC